MNTILHDYIIDHIGADNWEQVYGTFHGMNREEVTKIVNEMFPEDDNGELINKIMIGISRYS